MSRSRSLEMPVVTNRQTLAVMFAHMRRYVWRTVLALVAIVFAESLSVSSQWFYKQFIDAISSSSRNPALAYRTVVLIVVLHLAAWLSWRVAGYTTGWLVPRVMTDLENTSFRYLIGHSYQFFADSFAGSLVRRVSRLSRAYADIVDVGQWRLLPLVVSSSWILFFVAKRSPAIALAFFIWIVLFVSLNFYSVRIRHRLRVERAAKDSEVTGALADALTNVVNIKLFSGLTREAKRFDGLAEERRVLHTRQWWTGESNMLAQNILMFGVEIVVMGGAVHFWAQGVLSVGDVVLFQTYLIALFSKLFDFGKVLRTLYEAFAEAQEMVEILKLPHGIADRPSAKDLLVTRGDILFDEVSFKYQQGQTVLRDVTMRVRSGEKVALVGPSGAGKSTIVKILFRFYEITRGKILIDGQDISRVTQESLRDQISLVPQEPILFHRTLRENIRYGRPGASDEEVVEAARQAHCHEFISGLDKGYDTYVGERGIKLSGGERQRVAIARAILKNAPILVLDEATSSLDSESEALIQDALRVLMRDKTVIVIAHRLSTIMQMDRIIVLENGTVADMGTHQELLRTEGGLYKKLWQLQAGGFLE
jgi:ATP-binding cassette subfamily B protein